MHPLSRGEPCFPLPSATQPGSDRPLPDLRVDLRQPGGTGRAAGRVRGGSRHRTVARRRRDPGVPCPLPRRVVDQAPVVRRDSRSGRACRRRSRDAARRRQLHGSVHACRERSRLALSGNRARSRRLVARREHAGIGCRLGHARHRRTGAGIVRRRHDAAGARASLRPPADPAARSRVASPRRRARGRGAEHRLLAGQAAGAAASAFREAPLHILRPRDAVLAAR